MKALDKTKIDTVFESDSSQSSSSSSSSLSSSSVETAECSRKLWKKPHSHQHNSTVEDTSNEGYTEGNNDLMDQAKESLSSNNKHRRQHQHHPHHQHRRNENNLAVTRNSSNDASSKRQTKLLLVSLIESLCQTYGDSPESTRKIFLMICQTLSSLGFIDSEFIDEVAGVRSTYHKAFEQLFYTAAQTVRQQELRSGNQPKLLTSAQQQEILKERIESLSTSHSSTSSIESLLADDGEIAEEDISRPLKYSLSIQQSRYNNDFVQVGMLGRGGFASAWRARNKLDDIEYAIKKIRLLDQEEDDGYDKIFREIKNLARLEHHNVVRYYSSWLEYAASIDENQGEDDEEEDLSWLSSSSPNNGFEYDDDDDDNSSIFNGQDPTFELSEEDSLNNNQPTTAEEMSFISFGTSDNEPSEPDNLQLCASSSNSTIRKSCHRGSSARQTQEKGGFILFIQMQLCPSTLHEYLKFRNQNPSEYFDDQQNIDLFSQILQGCAYIHQQGLIHRDLKPSNIFLSRPATVPEHRNRRRAAGGSSTSLNDAALDCKCCSEALIPKIGDFGLAASVLHAEDEANEVMDDEDEHYLASTFESQHSNSSNSIIELFAASHPRSHRQHYHRYSSKHDASSSNSDSFLSLHADSSFKSKERPRLRRNRTSGVGTRTYAAPEQLATPSYNYDEKADIYSLGIILFELYHPFSSGMERAIAIDQLKKGIFPDKFSQMYPVEKQVISRMMNPDPCLRPTALEILDLDIFNPSSQHHPQQEQQQIEHIESAAAISTTTAELNIIHDREMAEMRDRYCQMKQEKEDLQRRLDELEHKLNHCNVDEHPNKRPHELDDDDEEVSAADVTTEHQHKKKEMDSLFQSTLLAKFMMPN
ncbi:hypothetical protein PS6_006701 [Mucor atramentarius]